MLSYRLNFIDQRYKIIHEDEEMRFYNKHWANNKYKYLNAEQIKEHLGKGKLLHVDLLPPVEKEEQVLPIPAYLLGALIGDAGITHTIRFSNTDQELLDRVDKEARLVNSFLHQNSSQCGTCDYGVLILENGKPRLKNLLKILGLFGLTSEYKFIPAIYKEGSIEQRLALLQGLFDTDGYVSKEGCPSYCSVSKVLARDVQELIWSIGGIAKISEKIKHYTYNGVKKTGKLAYQVNVRMKEPECLFYLSRKRGRALNNQQYRHRLRLQIVSIEEQVA